MSAYFTTVDTADWPWPTSVGPRRVSFPVGQRVARPQKDGLPSPRGRLYTVQGHRLALEGGQPGRCPFPIRGRKWRPSRATSLCSPSCRCSAQSLLGREIETFL